MSLLARSAAQCAATVRRAAASRAACANANDWSQQRRHQHSRTYSSSSSSSSSDSGGFALAGVLVGLGGLGALVYVKRNQILVPLFEKLRQVEAAVPSPAEAGSIPPSPPEPYAEAVSSATLKTTTMDKTAVADLPKHVTYLLVGAGTASFAAYRAIKARDARAKILIVGDEERLPYMRPPLSKEMWYSDKVEPKVEGDVRFRQWNGRDRSVFFEHPTFYTSHADLAEKDKGGIAVVTGRKVVRIDATKREAHLDNGSVIAYDKCLLATGGKPKPLAVLDRNAMLRRKVSLFRDINDFYRLEDIVKRGNRIAIVGGGFLGSELACALAHYKKMKKLTNLEIYQIFPEIGNMAKVFPDYLSQWTTSQVESEGISVLSGTIISDAYVTERGKLKLFLDGKRKDAMEVDHAVVAIGIRPNTELAGPSRLEVDDKLEGFRVNAELEARSNLWSAGDAASFFDPVLGRRRVEHHDHAVVSGRLAGENMTGAGRPYTHQSMFWSDLGPKIGYEAIGLVDSTLNTVGVFAKATKRDSPKAASEESGGTMRSDAEAEEVVGSEKAVSVAEVEDFKDVGNEVKKGSNEDADSTMSGEGNNAYKYGKGIIFYLNDESRVVGLLMWNIFGRMGLARKIVRENKKYEDLAELAKLFKIHDDEP